MNKNQWKNLWHSYRWMRRLTTEGESIAWCAHFCATNGVALKHVITEKTTQYRRKYHAQA